jgi:hypothetical protein
MKIGPMLLLLLTIHAAALWDDAQNVDGAATLIVRSGMLQLRAFLRRPKG